MKWPENGEPAHFSDIANPIYEAIQFAYKLERKNVDKDIPYNGLEIGDRELVTNLPAKEKLSKEHLEWVLDDQGFDVLTEILTLAIQLGIEQGRRIDRSSSTRELVKGRLAIISAYLDEIEDMI